MRELFDKLTHDFDFILIDSPPVVPVVDAVLLDRLTGGTLMVVASHRTKKRDVASAVKQLETVGAKLAGFALNFVPISESDARPLRLLPLPGDDEEGRGRQGNQGQALEVEGPAGREVDVTAPVVRSRSRRCR